MVASARSQEFAIIAERQRIDEALMAELEQIRAATQPQEVLLVVDAMVGQDAVNSAKEFDTRLPITVEARKLPE